MGFKAPFSDSSSAEVVQTGFVGCRSCQLLRTREQPQDTGAAAGAGFHPLWELGWDSTRVKNKAVPALGVLQTGMCLCECAAAGAPVQ